MYTVYIQYVRINVCIHALYSHKQTCMQMHMYCKYVHMNTHKDVVVCNHSPHLDVRNDLGVEQAKRLCCYPLFRFEGGEKVLPPEHTT